MKRIRHHLFLATLCALAPLLSPAQTLLEDVQLQGDNTLATGATLDVSAGTVTFADGQIGEVAIDGLTAALAAKQPLDADLSAIAALSTTSFGRAFLEVADAAALRAYAGLVIGANVQAWSSVLDAYAADPFAVVYSATDDDPEYMRSLLVIGNVDNTSDADKPVSTAQAAAILYSSATRATDGWLYSDGSPSNCFVQTLTSRHNLAGAAFASWVGCIDVPLVAPTTDAYIVSLASVSSGTISTAWSLNIRILATSGTLGVRQVRGTAGSFRGATLSNFVSSYAGQRIFMQADFTRGSDLPVLKINGVVQTLVADSGGTATDYLDPSALYSVSTTGHGGWPAGVSPIGAWLNRHLTDAEVTTLRLTGRWPADALRGGSAVNLIGNISRNSDFSAGATDWIAAGTGGAVAVVDNTLQITGPAGGGGALNVAANITGGSVVDGACYRISFDVLAGTTGVWNHIIGATNEQIDTNINMAALIGTRYSVEKVITVSGGTQFFRLVSAAGSLVLNIDNAKVEFLGLLSLPTVGPDRVVRDATRLSPPQDGYLVGLTPQATLADGWIRGRRTSDGYALADTQLVGDGRGIVQIMAKSVSGGTVSIGESAGSPATLVASVSLTAGATTPLTLLKSIPAGGKIYIDLGTATDVEIYVRTGPVVSLVLHYQDITHEALLAGLFADRWRADLPLAA